MSTSDTVAFERPSLGNVAIAVVLGLIGFYIAAATVAGGLSTIPEASLAVAGFAAFGIWSCVAYLEAKIVDERGNR